MRDFVPLVACVGTAPACCVVGRTRVRTPSGVRPIEALAVGDAVLSVDVAGGRLVPTRVAAVRTATRACVSLQTDASTLVCTPDHPVYLPDAAEYDDAKTAAPGRRLAHVGPRGVLPTAVVGLGTPAGSHRVYDITVDSPLHNFIAEDVVVHNKSYDSCIEAFEAPPVVQLDEGEPSRRLLVRPCVDGRDLTDGELDVFVDVRADAGGPALRVGAYFDRGTPRVYIDGAVPFEDALYADDLRGACTTGLPLVLERLDEHLDRPVTVSMEIFARDCSGDGAAEVTLDVES